MVDVDVPALGNSESSVPSNERKKEVRRRQRQTLSCLPCRRLKVKCDRGRPCGHCIWSDRAASCRYAAFTRNTEHSSPPADGSSGDDQLQALKAITPPAIRPKPKHPLLPKRPELQNVDSDGHSPSVSDPTSSNTLDVSSRKEECVRSQYNFNDLHVVWRSKFRGATHWSSVLREVRTVLHEVCGFLTLSDFLQSKF